MQVVGPPAFCSANHVTPRMTDDQSREADPVAD
jgi:hypothetical protein